MAGTLVISTLSDGTNSTSATNCVQGSAKAWVKFNGTTSPGTINGSYNVSSVTKGGTGNYTLNFTSSLSDANYAFVGNCADNGVNNNMSVSAQSGYTYTASALQIETNKNSAALDPTWVNIAIFR